MRAVSRAPSRPADPTWHDRSVSRAVDNEILDEVFRNIIKNRPDLDLEKLDRTRDLMNGAIRDVLVDNYEELIDGLTLPDADDRHSCG